jgi:cation diffusion facilitator CzcD-associated flavoprotein CzcO
MLQRSPSYIVAMPARDPLATWAGRRLPDRIAHPLVRWKSVFMQWFFYRLSRRRPELVKRLIRRWLERELPAGFDIDTHFTPSYQPWDQRLCLAPDGDFFRAISDGDASIVTGSIDRFTASGIRLSSGEEIDADVIVTATGLNLLALGGIELTVDGRRRELSELIGYKGLMLSGVPNLALTLGYTNASWTLKCDLTAEYVCRLLDHMDRHGYRIAMPREPGPEVPREPFLDLRAGYVLRAIDDLPKQGPEPPWRLHQNYARDVVLLRHRPVADDAMSFSH